MDTIDDWDDIIDQLAQVEHLPTKAMDFIDHLQEGDVYYLTDKQVEWLKDLQDRYL